jgi:hypothetical protein
VGKRQFALYKTPCYGANVRATVQLFLNVLDIKIRARDMARLGLLLFILETKYVPIWLASNSYKKQVPFEFPEVNRFLRFQKFIAKSKISLAVKSSIKTQYLTQIACKTE